MKVKYNDKMNELILERKIDNNFLEIDNNFLEIDNDFLEIDNDLDIYNDYYFYSNRIDKFSMNKKLSFIHYLNISILIWTSWLYKVKNKFKKVMFYLIIQYDDWSWFDENINYENEWFFIKLYTKEWFDEYFWPEWINKINVPYISIEL